MKKLKYLSALLATSLLVLSLPLQTLKADEAARERLVDSTVLEAAASSSERGAAFEARASKQTEAEEGLTLSEEQPRAKNDETEPLATTRSAVETKLRETQESKAEAQPSQETTATTVTQVAASTEATTAVRSTEETTTSTTSASSSAETKIRRKRSSQGEWKKVNGKWRWQFPDGSYAINRWVYIRNKWYVFDKQGWMITGWYKSGGKWYFLKSNGEMNTEPLVRGVSYYEFNYPNGDMYMTKLSLPRQQQKKSQWCWAACSAMVANFPKNYGYTQEDIVRKIKGSVKDVPGNPNEIIAAIRYASEGAKNCVYEADFSYEKICSRMDTQKTCVICTCGNSVGHAVVGAGYNLKGRKIYCVDPASSNVSDFYSVGQLKNGAIYKKRLCGAVYY